MSLSRTVKAQCKDCNTTFTGPIIFGLIENEYPSADGAVIDQCAQHHVTKSMQERGMKGKHDLYIVTENRKRLGNMNVTSLGGPVLFNVEDRDLEREIDQSIRPRGERGY